MQAVSWPRTVLVTGAGSGLALASADADLAPDSAAERMLSWLERLPTTAMCGYWDDQGRPIPW